MNEQKGKVVEPRGRQAENKRQSGHRKTIRQEGKSFSIQLPYLGKTLRKAAIVLVIHVPHATILQF